MTEEKKKPPYTNRGVTLGFPQEQTGKNGRVVDAGIDWLTCTSPDDKIGLAWFETFRRLSAGSDITDWRNPWYEGKMSISMRWGYNPTVGYILMATGGFAAVVWAATVPRASKVTRIDLQVTVELPEPNVDLARDAYSDNSQSGYRKYGLIQTSRGGQTLYVGSRQSEKVGRLYDSGALHKTHQEGVLWRYEVELKKPSSDVVAKRLLDWREENGNEVWKAIIPYTFNWFLHRGVGPVFSHDGPNELVVEIGKKVTSDEKKLEWLRTQVRPTIQRLLGAGKAELLSAALGCKVEQLHMLDK